MNSHSVSDLEIPARLRLVSALYLRELWRHVTTEALLTGSKQSINRINMAAITISALSSFFSGEPKSIERGGNHHESDYIESFIYSHWIIRRSVHASLKNKSYKVTVSEIHKHLLIDVVQLVNFCIFDDDILSFYPINTYISLCLMQIFLRGSEIVSTNSSTLRPGSDVN